MKVYITYDRYEHNEWFNIYQITTKMSEVRKEYKKNLIDFITYGPDDCHSYQIQIVDLTKEEFELIKNHIDNTVGYDDNDDDLMKLMEKIYDECRWCQYTDTNCLLCTDGCSDYVDMVDFWIEYKGLDENDRDQIEDDIYNDDTLFQKVLKKYINYTYQF